MTSEDTAAMSTPTKYEGHTPGPWNIEGNKKSFTVGKPKDKLGSCMFAEIVAKEIKTQANARLIADAPALLAERDTLKSALGNSEKLYTAVCDELAASKAENTQLREALQACINSGLGHHDHWDDTMQHGKGCLRCIKQTEAYRIATAALAAGKGEMK